MDMIFLSTSDEPYAVVQYDISSVKEGFHKGAPYYFFATYPYGDTYSPKVIMDSYHYNELIDLKEQAGNKKIEVHYLPNTKLMLEYIIIE